MPDPETPEKVDLLKNLINSLKAIQTRVKEARKSLTMEQDPARKEFDRVVTDLGVIIEFLEPTVPKPEDLKTRGPGGTVLLITDVC